MLEYSRCGVTGVVATTTRGVCGVHVGKDQTRTAGLEYRVTPDYILEPIIFFVIDWLPLFGD